MYSHVYASLSLYDLKSYFIVKTNQRKPTIDVLFLLDSKINGYLWYGAKPILLSSESWADSYIRINPLFVVLIPTMLTLYTTLWGVKWLDCHGEKNGQLGHGIGWNMVENVILWHIEAETKRPPFSRRHLQMHFHEWKCMNFDSNFTEVCP